jgi:hypothetical protein
MNLPNTLLRRLSRGVCVALLSAALAFLSGCGGSSSSTTVPPPTGSTVNNTQAIQVNLGPTNNYANGIFTNVTICVPGTSSCQTIPNVLVDTGSYGLRLLESQVTLALPQSTDSSGNVLQECISFADGSYVWGPVATADIQLAAEKASSVPIQLISSAASPAVPSSCSSSGGPNNDTVDTLGAYGILGIGPFQQDCGTACTSSSTSIPPQYYLCPSSGCTQATVSVSGQLQNPVWLFPQDNNGVMVTLPSVPDSGAPTVAGSLIFGIGTQSNNGLGSAALYTTDSNGNLSTTFNGTTYSGTYFDTGSNSINFLDSATLGIPGCPDPNSSFYCPASTVNYSAINAGVNGTTAQISFNVANADALFSSNNAAFSNLAGPNPKTFFWGLPFFFGRNVFVGIEGQMSPGGVVGPYWAF